MQAYGCHESRCLLFLYRRYQMTDAAKHPRSAEMRRFAVGCFWIVQRSFEICDQYCLCRYVAGEKRLWRQSDLQNILLMPGRGPHYKTCSRTRVRLCSQSYTCIFSQTVSTWLSVPAKQLIGMIRRKPDGRCLSAQQITPPGILNRICSRIVRAARCVRQHLSQYPGHRRGPRSDGPHLGHP